MGEGFSGLARHFRRHLEDEGIDPVKAPSKLFVTGLRSNSIEFELATLAALYVFTTAAVDGFVIWTDFYNRVKKTIDYLAGHTPRPGKYSREDAKDYDSFLRTIAGKRGAKLNVRRAKFHKKTGKREILAEFEFNEVDLSNAYMNLAKDLTDFDRQEDSPVPSGSNLTLDALV